MNETDRWRKWIFILLMIIPIQYAIFIGFSMIFLAIFHFFRENTFEKRFCIIGSIFGILSALLMLGVAFTPWDLYEEAHNSFARASFIASLIMAVI